MTDAADDDATEELSILMDEEEIWLGKREMDNNSLNALSTALNGLASVGEKIEDIFVRNTLYSVCRAIQDVARRISLDDSPSSILSRSPMDDTAK